MNRDEPMERRFKMNDRWLSRSAMILRSCTTFFTVITYGSMIAELVALMLTKQAVLPGSSEPVLFVALVSMISGSIVQIPSLILALIFRQIYAIKYGRTRFGIVLLILLLPPLFFVLLKLPLVLSWL